MCRHTGIPKNLRKQLARTFVQHTANRLSVETLHQRRGDGVPIGHAGSESIRMKQGGARCWGLVACGRSEASQRSARPHHSLRQCPSHDSSPRRDTVPAWRESRLSLRAPILIAEHPGSTPDTSAQILPQATVRCALAAAPTTCPPNAGPSRDSAWHDRFQGNRHGAATRWLRSPAPAESCSVSFARTAAVRRLLAVPSFEPCVFVPC